jgi:hypothetical protein
MLAHDLHLETANSVVGDLNVLGDTDFGKRFPFPLLENVGGSFVIAYTGMKHFPKTIKSVGKHVIISDRDPNTLVDELRAAKRSGVIHGEIMSIITP